MQSGYLSKKVALMIGSIMLLVGLVFYVGTLVRNDTLCIERTSVQPDARLFADAEAFRDSVSDFHMATVDVLIRQFGTDTGFFVYSQHPNGDVSEENNEIRQLLASRVLAVESQDSDDLRTLHVQNIRAILKDWYVEENGEGYVHFEEKSKLGGNAMFLRTLVASPFFDTYRSEAEALVRGILALQHEDGSFDAWYKEPSYTYDEEYLLTFYSGEAILALLEYAEQTGDQRVYDAAVRSQDFYINRYVHEIDAHFYPSYVSWHTQSLAHLYTKTGDPKYADAIFVLNDRLLMLQDREEFVGRFYNPATPEYGNPHAASDAVYTEGLAHAYAVAKAVGDEVRQKTYYDALVYGMHNLKSLQFKGGIWDLFADGVAKKKLNGGIMTHSCSSWVRIDTVAHAADAFSKITKILGNSAVD